MCFSTGASFAGGAIISAIGIFTVREIQKPSQLVFASIPLFFGIQQIAEGCLWLTLPESEFSGMQKFATYFFLLMAQVLWPIVIPISTFSMEESRKRRKILLLLLGLGLLLGFYYAFCLLRYNVKPQIIGFHVQYNTDFPETLALPAFILYLIVTIIPLYVSGVKRTHLLGSLMFLSCLVTGIFFTQYIISVWCFFAALISGVIFWILRDSKKEFKLMKLTLVK